MDDEPLYITDLQDDIKSLPKNDTNNRKYLEGLLDMYLDDDINVEKEFKEWKRQYVPLDEVKMNIIEEKVERKEKKPTKLTLRTYPKQETKPKHLNLSTLQTALSEERSKPKIDKFRKYYFTNLKSLYEQKNIDVKHLAEEMYFRRPIKKTDPDYQLDKLIREHLKKYKEIIVKPVVEKKKAVVVNLWREFQTKVLKKMYLIFKKEPKVLADLVEKRIEKHYKNLWIEFLSKYCGALYSLYKTDKKVIMDLFK